jgi:hypothetical protein
MSKAEVEGERAREWENGGWENGEMGDGRMGDGEMDKFFLLPSSFFNPLHPLQNPLPNFLS